MPRFSWLALITKGISKSDANHEKLFGEYVFHRPLYQFVHEMPFRSCERISQDFLQVFRPDVFPNPMRCLLLRILVGLTRGSIVGLARRRSTMLSVLFSLSFLQGGCLSELPTQPRLHVGVLAHGQERFLQEVAAHALDALLLNFSFAPPTMRRVPFRFR